MRHNIPLHEKSENWASHAKTQQSMDHRSRSGRVHGRSARWDDTGRRGGESGRALCRRREQPRRLRSAGARSALSPRVGKGPGCRRRLPVRSSRPGLRHRRSSRRPGLDPGRPPGVSSKPAASCSPSGRRTAIRGSRRRSKRTGPTRSARCSCRSTRSSPRRTRWTRRHSRPSTAARSTPVSTRLGEGWRPLLSAGKQQSWDKTPSQHAGDHYGIIELELGPRHES